MKKTTNLTTAESCLAYLRSLGTQEVELPCSGELTSAAADAVSMLADQHASAWARERNQWTWRADHLVAIFQQDEFDRFVSGIAATLHVARSEADAQWAGYSRQLSDAERAEIEAGGFERGREIGTEIAKLQ